MVHPPYIREEELFTDAFTKAAVSRQLSSVRPEFEPITSRTVAVRCSDI